MTDWQPMETAPRDGTRILGDCVHEADPYYVGETRLTTYGAHAEGARFPDDGVYIVTWGGELLEYEYEYTNTPSAHIPDWWFLAESDFEVVANPVRWMPLPEGTNAR